MAVTLQESLDLLARTVARVQGLRPVPWTEWGIVSAAGAAATVVVESDESGTPRAAVNEVGALTVGARVVVRHEGSRISIVAAPSLNRDSGWVAVPLLAGFTGSLAVRVRGPEVYVRGEIAGAWTTTLKTVASIPLAARPAVWADTYRSLQRGTTPAGARGYISATGDLVLACATGTASDTIYAGGLSGYLTN